MKKRGSSNDDAAAGGAGKKASRNKLLVLAAITLLAICTLFTRSVTLRSWFALGNLNFQLDDPSSMINLEDLDVLEVEERVKVVRHMWDAYHHSTHGSSIPILPQFWSQAFESAYEHLVSDVPAIRDAAILEIAKMSIALRSQVILHQLSPFTLQLQSQSHDQTEEQWEIKKNEAGRVARMLIQSTVA